MVEVKYHTLTPLSEVLNNAPNHASPKYDIPLVDLFINTQEYSISLGKESARHKKCYLLLEGKNGNGCSIKFQSEHTDNIDLPDLFKSLVNMAATDAGVVE